MIRAIVLAAGESRRMGKPKPLLRFGNTTFLGQIIRVLQSCKLDGITVVLGARAETIRAATDLSPVDVVMNENYHRGQLSSLIAGLKSLPVQTEAILLCLVDNPCITAEVVGRVIAGFRQTRSPIVIPVFNHHRGHPALFARSMFVELTQAPVDKGARHVISANEGRVLEVEVSDDAVSTGIDTPEDYRRYFGADPEIASADLTREQR